MKPKARALLLDRYRVADGRGFRLRDHDPADTAGLAGRIGPRVGAPDAAQAAALEQARRALQAEAP